MINDRPTELRVDLDALLNNYNKLTALNNEKTGIAIVKADSYGLGARVIADHLYKNGVRHFATATLEEALELKDVIFDSMVLVLGVTNPQNVKYAVENNISLTCPSKVWLEECLEELENIRTQALKINELLQKLYLDANLVLVDFKIEFGKTKDGEIILADEISPDTCRLWDKDTNEKLDKDRFRRDLGSVMEAYEEVLRRLKNA